MHAAAEARRHYVVFDEHLTRQHRLTYFVRGPEWAIALPTGDLEALEDVMRRCAAFWNGTGTLLIPVREDGHMPRLLDAWLQIRPVDVCFAHGRLSDRARASVQARIRRTWPFRETFDVHELNPLELWGPLPIEGDRRLSMLIPRFRSVGLQRVALALFGHVSDEDLSYWRQRYDIAVAGEPRAHSVLLQGQMPNGNSPLKLAARHMNTVLEHPPPTWSYLWVLPDASFDRLIAFWNFRARTLPPPYGAAVAGIPRQAFHHPEQLATLRYWPPRLPGVRTTPDIAVVCPRYLIDEVREGFSKIPLLETDENAFRWEVGGRAIPNDPPSYCFSRPQYWSGPMIRGQTAIALVAFNEGKAALSLPAPQSFAARSGRYTRLVLQNLPVPLPVTGSTARRIHDHGEASDGVLMVTDAREAWNFDVRLPTSGEALQDWITDHGFVLTRSQDGRDAEALLTRLGSVDALDVLADRKRIGVLEALAPLSRKKLAQRLVSEARAAGGELREESMVDRLSDFELFLRAAARTANEIATVMGQGVRKRDVLRMLPPLVQAGFVLRGREVRCERCRFRNQLDLPEQDERVRCRACGQSLVLPVVDESGDNEPELTYRLDGLMARVMDQDVLPVLLSVRALKPTPESGQDLFFAWPGVETKKGTEPKFDVDVVVSYGGGSVWCVEAKRRASGMKERQLTRLLQVARELEATPGIAAMEGRFPSAHANRVLKARGVVLTDEQLFS